MRVVRERSFSNFPVVRVYGPRPDFSPVVETAHALERPIGRGGGMRDPVRTKLKRTRYVTVAVSKNMHTAIELEAATRGLSRAALLGLIVEGAFDLKPEMFDELLAGAE